MDLPSPMLCIARLVSLATNQEVNPKIPVKIVAIDEGGHNEGTHKIGAWRERD